MEASVLDGLLRLRIEPGGMRIALAANIRRDGAFKFRLAQLLEDRGAEHRVVKRRGSGSNQRVFVRAFERSEEHTSELQSLAYLVCRLLLEKKKKTNLRLPPQQYIHQR